MKTAEKPCPVGKVVELLGDNCSILIVRDLLEGPRRFGELETSLGSSSRTLAKKLKLLEHEKMVTRKESKDEPSCVKYQLTRKGEAFHGVVDAMRAYGKKYL
ncbi:MAG TPA: helix-turn-helix domain-containing protein [Candidatus Paceibacterota bacterium]|nr:helix-turn-helix domain-containing protein [Candidatus Paceibacterota bacterium]